MKLDVTIFLLYCIAKKMIFFLGHKEGYKIFDGVTKKSKKKVDS